MNAHRAGANLGPGAVVVVAGVSPVPVQMWQEREEPVRRKGRVEPSPGTDAGGTPRMAEKAAEATYEREPVRMQPGGGRGRGRPVIAFGEGPTV